MAYDRLCDSEENNLVERANEVVVHILDGMQHITGQMSESELTELKISLMAQALAHLRAYERTL